MNSRLGCGKFNGCEWKRGEKNGAEPGVGVGSGAEDVNWLREERGEKRSWSKLRTAFATTPAELLPPIDDTGVFSQLSHFQNCWRKLEQELARFLYLEFNWRCKPVLMLLIKLLHNFLNCLQGSELKKVLKTV